MSQIAKFIDHNTARRAFHQAVATYKSDPSNGDYQRISEHIPSVSAGYIMAWPIRNKNQSFRHDDLSYFNHITEMGLVPQSVVAAVSDPRKHHQEHSKHIVVRIVRGHVKGTITSRRSLDKFLCGSHCHMSSAAWPLSEWRMP